MGTVDFLAEIAIEIFPKVRARQLRCGAAGFWASQPIAIGGLAATAACGVGGVSAD
jgi:hypothetical protein